MNKTTFDWFMQFTLNLEWKNRIKNKIIIPFQFLIKKRNKNIMNKEPLILLFLLC